VVDASAPDRDEQIEQVERVLAEIGADRVPTILVYNKIDLAGLAPESHLDPCGNIDRLMLSARTGAGLDALRGALTDRVAQARQSAEPGALSDSDHVPVATTALDPPRARA
jgi:GTP-binding protein HflX